MLNIIKSELEREALLLRVKAKKIPFLCDLKKIPDSRSISQNKLYWSWIGLYVYEQSGTKDAILAELTHNVFKEQFIRFKNECKESEYDTFAMIWADRKEYSIIGKKEPEKRSSTLLDLHEFSKFMTLVKECIESQGIKCYNQSDKDFALMVEYYSQFI